MSKILSCLSKFLLELLFNMVKISFMKSMFYYIVHSMIYIEINYSLT